ncbi:MAG: hypothetical protein ACYS8Z_26805 [Planctomycetota bacterium]|jgi:hypothetical protein
MKKIMRILISSAAFAVLTGIFGYAAICIVSSFLQFLSGRPIIGFDTAFYVSFFYCCLVGSTIGIYWGNWRFSTEKRISIVAIATGSFLGHLAARYLSPLLLHIGIGANLGALLTVLSMITFSFMGYYLGKSIQGRLKEQ